MKKARRAKPRQRRPIVPITVAAALVVGGSVAALRFWPDSDEVGAGPVAVSPSQAPTAAPEPESSATASPVVAPSLSATANEAAEAALTGCRAKVAEADKIIGAATKGVVNWGAHVQAQTDSFAVRSAPTNEQDLRPYPVSPASGSETVCEREKVLRQG